MENVKISKVCGLCAGCKNAISKTVDATKSHKKVCIFKEIVHNPNVNKFLSGLGVEIIDTLDNVSSNDFVVIRAHGEPPETYEYLKTHSIPFVDCTCVNVENIHKDVNKHSLSGYTIIIIGKYGKSSGKAHPEMAGTIGWCNTPPILIEDHDDISKISDSQSTKFYLVCQTTFNESKADKFIEEISQICKDKNAELVINKSICNAQKSINKFSVELAKESDLMIVVGGKNSSNSIELFNNLKQYKPAIFIEDISTWFEELENIGYKFTKNTKVGLTAGASTQKEELLLLKELIENKQMELSHEN